MRKQQANTLSLGFPKLPDIAFDWPKFPGLPTFKLPCIKLFGITIAGSCDDPPVTEPESQNVQSTPDSPKTTLKTGSSSPSSQHTRQSATSSQSTSTSSNSSSTSPSSCSETHTLTDCRVSCSVSASATGASSTTICYTTTCHSTTAGCSVEATTSTTVSTPEACPYQYTYTWYNATATSLAWGLYPPSIAAMGYSTTNAVPNAPIASPTTVPGVFFTGFTNLPSGGVAGNTALSAVLPSGIHGGPPILTAPTAQSSASASSSSSFNATNLFGLFSGLHQTTTAPSTSTSAYCSPYNAISLATGYCACGSGDDSSSFTSQTIGDECPYTSPGPSALLIPSATALPPTSLASTTTNMNGDVRLCTSYSVLDVQPSPVMVCEGPLISTATTATPFAAAPYTTPTQACGLANPFWQFTEGGSSVPISGISEIANDFCARGGYVSPDPAHLSISRLYNTSVTDTLFFVGLHYNNVTDACDTGAWEDGGLYPINPTQPGPLASDCPDPLCLQAITSLVEGCEFLAIGDRS